MNAPFILAGTVLVIILNLMGFTELVYPIRLFITYVHEWGHAFAAMMTGGTVHSMAVNPDASGVTYFSGGIHFIVASAGYLGTLFVGCLSILSIRVGIKSGIVLMVFAGVVLMNVFYANFAGFTILWGLILAAILIVSAWSPLAMPVAIFMSLQLMLGAFYDMKTLLSLSISSNTFTDAMAMRQATGIPATFWALLWLVISALVAWKVLVSCMEDVSILPESSKR